MNLCLDYLPIPTLRAMRDAARESLIHFPFESDPTGMIKGTIAQLEKEIVRRTQQLAAIEERRQAVAELEAEIEAREGERQGPYELAYRFPGRGGWRRATFPTEKARQDFARRLAEKHGDDVETRYGA